MRILLVAFCVCQFILPRAFASIPGGVNGESLAYIGVSTDAPTGTTLWAALKLRRDAIPESEQARIFGAWEGTSSRTMCGRVNLLMNLLRIIEDEVPAAFVERLATAPDAIVKVAAHEDFALGNWFDHSGSVFGMLYELFQIIYESFPVFKSVALATLIDTAPLDIELLKETHILIKETFPHMDGALLGKYGALLENVLACGTPEERAPILFDLCELLHPLYLDVFVGDNTAPPSPVAYAPLFAKFKHTQSAMPAPVASELEDRLERLIKKIHPRNTSQYVDFYKLVSSNEISLSRCIIDALGSPFNTEQSLTPTFFTVFNDLQRRYYYIDEKFQLLMETLGTPSNTGENRTIFGCVAAEYEALDASPISLYKKQWIGCSNGAPFSLFSNLCEIQYMFNATKDQLPESLIDHYLTRIGIPGDTQNTSLFGAIHTLHDCHDFDAFARALGFGKSDPGSCFYFTNAFKDTLIPAEFLDIGGLPNFCIDTILELFTNPVPEPSVIAAETRRIIKQDFFGRLTDIIMPQLRDVRLVLHEQNAELLGYIGTDGDNIDGFDIFSKIRRLIHHISTAEPDIDITPMYVHLIYGPDSLQSFIYEIHMRATHSLKGIADVVGSVFSMDYSCFGAINKCLHAAILAPLSAFISPLHCGPDEEETVIGEILNNFLAVNVNFKDLPDDYGSILATIGAHIELHQLRANLLMNMVGFFYEILPHMSHLISYSNLMRYIDLIKGDTNSLLTMSQDLLTCNSRIAITSITGYTTGKDTTEITMWNTCRTIYSELYNIADKMFTPANILNLIEHENEYAVIPHLYDFIQSYKQKITYLQLFSERILHEQYKYNFCKFVKALFDVNATIQHQRSSFDQICVSSEELRKNSTYYCITTVSPANSAESLRNINEMTTLLMYALIASRCTDILTLDIDTPAHKYELVSAGISAFSGEYTSATSIMKRVKAKVSSLNGFHEETKLIGDTNDFIIASELDNITAWGLYNEVLQIMSQPEFFVESCKNLSRENILTHWYFEYCALIGSSYDNDSVASQRAFFETLTRLNALLHTPSVEEWQSVISLTIVGSPDVIDKSYHTIFSTLIAWLKHLLPWYSNFTFDYSSSKRNGVGTSLRKVYELFCSTSYRHLPAFLPLMSLGEPDEHSGFFGRLDECISAFSSADNINSLQVRVFLAYSKALSDEINEFIEKMSAPLEIDEVTAFIDRLDVLMWNLLATESCEGCEQIVEFLRSLYIIVEEAAQSIAHNTNEELVAIFENTSFGEIKTVATALQSAVALLLKKANHNIATRKSCISLSAQSEIAEILTQVSAMGVAVRALGKEVEPLVVEFPYNAMCLSLPEIVNNLTAAMNNFTQNLRLPVVSYIRYNETNVSDFLSIADSILAIFNTVQGIVFLKNCDGCDNDELKLEVFVNGMQQLVSTIFSIKEFLANSYACQLAYQFDNLSQILQKTSLYMVPANLFILPQTMQPVWDNISQGFAVIVQNVEHAVECFKINNSISAIVSALDDLCASLTGYCGHMQALTTTLGVDVPEEESEPRDVVYNDASVVGTFDSVLSHINYIAEYWDNSDMGEPLHSNWLIPILESIASGYDKLRDVMVEQIAHWEDKYNILDRLNLIRHVLSQQICPNVHNTVMRMKSYCAHNLTEQIKDIALQLSTFSSVITQVPCENIFTPNEYIYSFLGIWAQCADQVAQIFQYMRDKQDGGPSCLHFLVQEDLERLQSVLVQCNADVSGVLELSGTGTRAPSLAEAITQLDASLGYVNNWWQQARALNFKLDVCRHPLMSKLVSLQGSYASIFRNMSDFTSSSPCLYADIPLASAALAFADRVQQIQEITFSLNSDLTCTRLLGNEVEDIEHTLLNISAKFCVQSEGGCSIDISNLMAAEYLPTLLEQFTNINIVLSELAAFFQASTTGACITGAIPALAQIRSALATILAGMQGTDVDKQVDDASVIERVNAITSCMGDINERLLMGTLSFIPAPSSADAPTHKERADVAEQVVTQISATHDLLRTLAGCIEEAAPSFVSCFDKLGQTSAPIQRISIDVQYISEAIFAISEQVGAQYQQLLLDDARDDLDELTLVTDVDQCAWLASVNERDAYLSQELERLALLTCGIQLLPNAEINHPVVVSFLPDVE
ncbi:MAG: hypothetical protein LBR89_02740 [Holosporales bacterium]|jgi:hypothetical protein|nr:hypothetical protein [Holosporales bacterium]